jgi:4'-phosphopantetheinyl transferase
MYLYLYHQYNQKKGDRDQGALDRSRWGETLVLQALRDYCKRQGLGIAEEALKETVIERGDKGKPYFPAFSTAGEAGRPEIHFSVSHSGSFWGCLMGAEPVGFDLEVCRENVKYEKIARRFFSGEEIEFILSAGRSAFFDVWVRKEAYVKYTGAGLGAGLSGFSVAAGGSLASQVIAGTGGDAKSLPCFIRACEIAEGVKAAYCCAGGAPVKAVLDLDVRKEV